MGHRTYVIVGPISVHRHLSISIRVGVFLFLVFSVFLSKLVPVMAVQVERTAGLAPSL
jgi:hypothetical protein